MSIGSIPYTVFIKGNNKKIKIIKIVYFMLKEILEVR
jgi:hypothetical protein